MENVTKGFDIKALAQELGCEESEVQTMLNQIQYRKEYNSRPEVKERRKAYAAKRNARMKVLGALLKQAVK